MSELSPKPATWQQRLDHIVETMRDMSTHTDPQMMVQAYGTRIRQLLPNNTFVSISRRGLSKPYYRITRSSKWKTTINPWKDGDKLPLLQGGLLGELLYGGKPRLIGELNAGPDDPAYE